jgi:hypothetical protein
MSALACSAYVQVKTILCACHEGVWGRGVVGPHVSKLGTNESE